MKLKSIYERTLMGNHWVVGIFFLVLLFSFGLYSSFIGQDALVRHDKSLNQFQVSLPSELDSRSIFKVAILGDSDFYPVLRVAIPTKVRMASLLSPFGDGFNRDLLERFATDYGFSLQFVELTDFEEANKLLSQKKVDLAAGFIAPPKQDAPEKLVLSPAYQKVTPLLLTVGKTKKNEKNELMVMDPSLSKVVPQSTGALAEKPLSEDVSELVGYLEHGQAGYALVDNAYANLLRPLFNNVKTSTRSLLGKAYHHWMWRDDDSLQSLSLEAFWQEKDTHSFLSDLQEKYQAFLPVKQDRQQTAHLIKGLEDELVQYHNAINAASREYNIDPLLLTAIMYQESHFKNTMGQNGKGLMQLTNATAKFLGVNPADPTSNIKGGAKYLRSIFDSLPEDISYWDKWFLTLAAYNQGPGTLNAAMRYARKNNEKLNWRVVKESYLYLEKNPGVASRNHVRGKHVVNYVQKIRYYYFVLNGIVILDRPEAQHLTPILASRTDF